MIPKDEISSSAFNSNKCYGIFRGKTKAEVRRKVEKYFEQYPPQGYDTHIHREGWKDGYYEIYVKRWRSCD